MAVVFMMSAKLAIRCLLKTKVFYGYDVIISALDVTNKILSPE